MANYVQVRECVLVPPSKPTPIEVLGLSSLDSQPYLRFEFGYLLVYPSTGVGFNQAAVKDSLKSALGYALVPYYPFAGRLRTTGNDFGLEVVCGGQGVIFIEAVSDHLAKDFEKTCLCIEEWQKMISLENTDALKGAPLLAMQLTWLADGSAALGFCFNHNIADGIGTARFLNLVAKLASNGMKLDELETKHVWERHLLNRERSMSLEYVISRHPEFDEIAELRDESMCPSMTRLNGEQIKGLKDAASGKSQVGVEVPYTTFEVLAAHVWRCWARSMNFSENQVVKLLFFMNIRDRIKPNLPQGFYGNAIVVGCAETTLKELMTKNGLSHATKLVKAAKERVETEYVGEVIQLLSKGACLPKSVGALIMTQWTRLGLDTVDFGLGPPMHIGAVDSHRLSIILPVPSERDARKVLVKVPASAVERYKYLMNTIC